jgi:hypothetical protein
MTELSIMRRQVEAPRTKVAILIIEFVCLTNLCMTTTKCASRHAAKDKLYSLGVQILGHFV